LMRFQAICEKAGAAALKSLDRWIKIPCLSNQYMDNFRELANKFSEGGRTNALVSARASMLLVLGHLQPDLYAEGIMALHDHHRFKQRERKESADFSVVERVFKQHKGAIIAALRHIASERDAPKPIMATGWKVPTSVDAISDGLAKIDPQVGFEFSTHFAESMWRPDIYRRLAVRATRMGVALPVSPVPKAQAEMIARYFNANPQSFILALAVAKRKAPHLFERH